MDKNKVMQWGIIIITFVIIGYAGQKSWLIVHRDIFIILLLLLSFFSVSMFVFLNKKDS